MGGVCVRKGGGGGELVVLRAFLACAKQYAVLCNVHVCMDVCACAWVGGWVGGSPYKTRGGAHSYVAGHSAVAYVSTCTT